MKARKLKELVAKIPDDYEWNEDDVPTGIALNHTRKEFTVATLSVTQLEIIKSTLPTSKIEVLS